MIQICIGLVIFAANKNNATNTYVLLKEEDGFLKIPTKPLPDDLNGLSIVHEIIKSCSGVSGKWVEMTPKQVAIFDEVYRNPGGREILIAYSLYIPEPMKVYEGYKWVKFDELCDKNLFLDTEHVITNIVLGGSLYVI